jgi:hypothetical protein
MKLWMTIVSWKLEIAREWLEVVESHDIDWWCEVSIRNYAYGF